MRAWLISTLASLTLVLLPYRSISSKWHEKRSRDSAFSLLVLLFLRCLDSHRLAYTITFATLVATSQAARDIARKCKQRLEEFELSLFARVDLYAALKAVKDRGDVPQGEEERRVLGKYLWDFESNGLALSEEKRGKLNASKKKVQ